MNSFDLSRFSSRKFPKFYIRSDTVDINQRFSSPRVSTHNFLVQHAFLLGLSPRARVNISTRMIVLVKSLNI